MHLEDIHELCAAVCEHMRQPAPALRPDAAGVTAFTLCVDAVDLSFVQVPGGSGVGLLVVFGRIEGDNAVDAWRALLEANFAMFESDAPVFSCHPVSGDIVLQRLLRLPDVDVPRLCDSVARLVEAVHRWRKDHFLPTQEAAAPAHPSIRA